MSEIKINVNVISGAAQASVSGLANEAKKAEKQFKGLNVSIKGIGGQIEDAFDGTPIANAARSVSSFAQRLALTSPVLTGLAAAALAVGAALERSFAGEQIEKINKQFELLANQAGVSAEALKAGLEQIANGAIDTEDLLQSASKFLVEFGNNADRIPEVLDIARRATTLFGGEVTENFEQISQAIASGNTRSLRNLGIIVDQEEAYKSFAATLGVTANELNEAGKKQAVLEAVLAKGNTTFQNVNPNVAQLSTSFERLKVQIGEVADIVAVKANATFGGFFTNLFTAASEAIERFNLSVAKPGEGLDGLAQEARKTELEIKSLETEITRLQGAFTKDPGDRELNLINVQNLQKQKQVLAENLALIQAQISEFNEKTSQESKEATAARSEFVDPKRAQENAQKELEFLFALQAEKDKLVIAEKESQLIRDGEKSKSDEAELKAESEKLQKIREENLLHQTFLLGDLQKYLELKKKLQLDAAKKDAEEKDKTNKDEITKEKERVANRRDTLNTISTLQTSHNKTLAFAGKAAAVSTATIDGYAAVQKALASAPPPFNFALAALVGAATAANVQKIIATPAFEQGGIVGGTSFSGDNITARVNSGEMILNRQQQTELFNLANNGGSGSGEIVVHTSVQIGEQEIARAVSRQVAQGLRLGEGGV